MTTTTINVRLDSTLKQQTYAVLSELNISPSEAIRQYFQYIAENHRLPVKQTVISETEDELLQTVRYRLANPQPGIKVTLDDL